MIIYKTTNLINGKIYVGQTTKIGAPYKSYFGSGQLIHRAIEKYGVKNFKKEILCKCTTHDELNEQERYWISFLDSKNRKVGYNLESGGGYDPSYRPPTTEETKRKIGLASKGRLHSEKAKLKMSKSHIGITHTEESKQKMKDAWKNRTSRFTKEHKRKISESLKKYHSNKSSQNSNEDR